MTRSSRTRAVIVIVVATALSLLVSALLLRRYDSDLVIASAIACPLIGLIFGTALGACYGRLAFLHPALLLPSLYLIHIAAPSNDLVLVALLFMGLLQTPVAVIGVLLGGWLEGLPRAKGKPKLHAQIYTQVEIAFVLAFICMLGFSSHLATLLPARTPAPAWVQNFYAAWSFLALGALLWWVRPIHLYTSGGRKDLKSSARKRASGIYRFIILLSAARALPAPLLALTSLDAGVIARTALVSATEGYYLAYLCILYLEPYLFSDVMPALYVGPELYKRKTGATLSIRLKLWLMVGSLVVVPMILVSATLVQHHKSLAAIWPVPVSIVIISLCYVIGYLEVLYQSITSPLAELVRKMELVAEGDFTVRTSVLSDDELGRIKGHFNDMVEGLAQRERIKDTFGKFLSVEVARRLIDSGDIELGGEDIEATILFSDIRSFTTLSETMSAKAVVSFLNSYFAHITEPIMERGGFINKFIGDAVMGVFAPQFGSRNHVDDALLAALGMRDKLAEFNTKGLMPAPVNFGVGIHTGPLVAGNVGTEKRMEYTLIGDTVNIASRIEGENKALGSTILISGDAYDRLSPDIRSKSSFEKFDNIQIRGKRKTLTLYKVN